MTTATEDELRQEILDLSGSSPDKLEPFIAWARQTAAEEAVPVTHFLEKLAETMRDGDLAKLILLVGGDREAWGLPVD